MTNTAKLHKTKIGQKHQKLLKITDHCLKSFLQNKNKKLFCNKNFNQSFPETLQITLCLPRNEQYGQTTQKPKIGQKVKNTENRLEMIFMTKDQKECGDKQFVY